MCVSCLQLHSTTGLNTNDGRESTSDLLGGLEHQLFDQIFLFLQDTQVLQLSVKIQGAKLKMQAQMEVFEQAKSINIRQKCQHQPLILLELWPEQEGLGCAAALLPHWLRLFSLALLAPLPDTDCSLTALAFAASTQLSTSRVQLFHPK